MATVSKAVLAEPGFVKSATSLANPCEPFDFAALQEKLSQFVSSGFQKNKLMRPRSTITALVESVSDEILELPEDREFIDADTQFTDDNLSLQP